MALVDYMICAGSEAEAGTQASSQCICFSAGTAEDAEQHSIAKDQTVVQFSSFSWSPTFRFSLPKRISA